MIVAGAIFVLVIDLSGELMVGDEDDLLVRWANDDFVTIVESVVVVGLLLCTPK